MTTCQWQDEELALFCNHICNHICNHTCQWQDEELAREQEVMGSKLFGRASEMLLGPTDKEHWERVDAAADAIVERQKQVRRDRDLHSVSARLSSDGGHFVSCRRQRSPSGVGAPLTTMGSRPTWTHTLGRATHSPPPRSSPARPPSAGPAAGLQNDAQPAAGHRDVVSVVV